MQVAALQKVGLEIYLPISPDISLQVAALQKVGLEASEEASSGAQLQGDLGRSTEIQEDIGRWREIEEASSGAQLLAS